MKTIKFLFLTLLGFMVASTNLQAQSCTEIYQRANNCRTNGNYQDAILFYEQAKQCDPNLKSDCNKWIKWCKKHIDLLNIKDSKSNENISSIFIPYQGGDKLLKIVANNKWDVEGSNNWCQIHPQDNNESLVVQCRTANNSTREKTTTLTFRSGNIFKTVKVIQAARPEFINVAATQLSFPAQGTEQKIAVESNANWDIFSMPSWCKVSKDSSSIRIIVDPNKKIIERSDEIVIVSPSQSVTIRINQGAGDEHLTLSQNNINLSAEGDVAYMKVYTDADNWFVGDFPVWMNVQRIGKDSIRIECGKNIPNGEKRSGSVQVQTDRQKTGVMVTQNARLPQELIFPESSIVSGRNFSIGFTAGYNVPFVATSAGGDYVGSVIDYSLGTNKENANYKQAIGYNFGIFADIRLYKNIFLNVGANFMQLKYKNEFNEPTLFVSPNTESTYLKGYVENAYQEEYKHTMIELPILASYRFKINDASHVQLNLGPVLNFGLSAKMKFNGNTDSESLRKYNSITHKPADNNYYVHHTSKQSEFNLYQPCVLWEEAYTTGNTAKIQHHDTFNDSPLHRFNCGLRLGAAYEISGLSFGLSYTMMLTNMANKGYWDNKRWTILNNNDIEMRGYKQRIHTLEFKIAYTLRYLNLKKR